MKTQAEYNFERIAKAIGYLSENFKAQPNLEAVAEKVHLSPYHFQRLFTDWAGVSPKKFLQFISLSYAKKLLREDMASLSATSYETGLSGSSRLHDLFINIEGMTPAEYKNGGKHLVINYSFADSPFGTILVAATPKGICHLTFAEETQSALLVLKEKYPNAKLIQKVDAHQQNALFIFRHDWSKLSEIKLHLKGTDFQLKVWESLIRVPLGRLVTYKSIAAHMGKPKASRAVGSAVGANPVAFLIPCHRVIQSTGYFGEYHWGAIRKKAMIGWEASRLAAH